MPSLQTVTFDGTHADAYLPLYKGQGVWTIKAPDSAETVTANFSDTVDCHMDITVPSGYSFMVVPTISGSTGLVVNAGIWYSSGSPISLNVNVLNPTAGNLTPTGNTDLCDIIVFPPEDCKLSL